LFVRKLSDVLRTTHAAFADLLAKIICVTSARVLVQRHVGVNEGCINSIDINDSCAVTSEGAIVIDSDASSEDIALGSNGITVLLR
jgi:hypothetical protein